MYTFIKSYSFTFGILVTSTISAFSSLEKELYFSFNLFSRLEICSSDAFFTDILTPTSNSSVYSTLCFSSPKTSFAIPSISLKLKSSSKYMLSLVELS